jgi:predicted nucleic acid-binding protein
MAASLDTLPSGSDVLIDANILVYGLTGKSAQCRAFLERCSREEIIGVTVFETVNDATHQFMKTEATDKGLCASKAMTFLSQHPEQVKLLTDYWTNTQKLLALNLLFLPLEKAIVEAAQPERVAAGLLTNDSIIVATMREYGITKLATNDHGFDTVARITVFSPTDVP